MTNVENMLEAARSQFTQAGAKLQLAREQRAEAARKAHDEGMTIVEISSRLGVSRQYIHSLFATKNT